MMDMAKLYAKINAKKKEFVKNEKPMTPKLGINKFVLLPGWNPQAPELFWREFGAHYIKDTSNKVAGFYPCDEVIYGRECPVCQALANASRMTNDDATLDLIKQARAGRQFLVNAILIGENGNNPVVFALSKTAFEQLMNVIGAWGQAIFDPANPQVIQIERTGTGFETRYNMTVTPEKFPLPADVMSKVKNLDDYVNQRTDAMAKKAVLGLAGLTGTSLSMLGYHEPVQQKVNQQISYEDMPSTGAPEPVVQQAPVQQSVAFVQPQMTQAPVQPQVMQAPMAQPQMAQPVPQPHFAQQAQAVQPMQSVPLDAEMNELLAGLDGL